MSLVPIARIYNWRVFITQFHILLTVKYIPWWVFSWKMLGYSWYSSIKFLLCMGTLWIGKIYRNLCRDLLEGRITVHTAHVNVGHVSCLMLFWEKGKKQLEEKMSHNARITQHHTGSVFDKTSLTGSWNAVSKFVWRWDTKYYTQA